MATDDYSLLSDEEIEKRVLSAAIEQLGEEVEKMTPHQIVLAVALLQPEKETAWREKLEAIYLALQETEQLEALGKSLTKEQALAVLEIGTTTGSDHHKKLSSIFVGLLHTIFVEILQFATPSHLQILQNEGISEAIHHHLTLFIHEMTQEIDQQIQDLLSLSDDIDTLTISTLTREELTRMKNNLVEAAEDSTKILGKINNALKLAWNTNRADLLEKIVELKEQCTRIHNKQIGMPRARNLPPTGLYLALEQHLSEAYYNPENPDDPVSLNDDDPAVEALARLSIWYLKDYKEVGLLPQVTEEKELELDTETHSEKQCTNHREKLLEMVYDHLHRLCLYTVGDLKAAGIYSKEMLKEYITENKKLIE